MCADCLFSSVGTGGCVLLTEKRPERIPKGGCFGRFCIPGRSPLATRRLRRIAHVPQYVHRKCGGFPMDGKRNTRIPALTDRRYPGVLPCLIFMLIDGWYRPKWHENKEKFVTFCE